MCMKECSFFFLLGVIVTLALIAVGFFFLLNADKSITYNESDVNFDGVVDAQDAAILLVKLNKIFPAEK